MAKDFEPTYQTIKGKGDLLKELRTLAKKMEKVYIGTDPDREGEAIGFHLEESLKRYNKNIYRVLFNEITKTAVKAAIKQAGQLKMDKVSAQQTRRILDRIVGYKLSPLLWKKIMKGLSAGRVQSVATKIIVDREGEIDRFKPIEYWQIKAHFQKDEIAFVAPLVHLDGKKLDPKGFHIENEADATKIVKGLNQQFEITKLESKPRKQQPPAPYITSKLQQDGSSKLSFSPKKTMSVAQKLYEGKDVGKQYGTTGLITYMRTDSMRISNDANDAVRAFIEKTYGVDELNKSVRTYKSKKKSQDAHEAIRPTIVEITPTMAKPYLTADEFKLYRLIWNRFVATQMVPAIFQKTVVEFTNKNGLFKAQGEILQSEGFLALNEKRPEGNLLPQMKNGEKMKAEEVTQEQKFTQPPARYSEATLIKYLEDQEIGRPSTYASIVSTIQDRQYVERTEGKFVPSEIGKVVTDQLIKFFPEIMSTDFTSSLEKDLDMIEAGEKDALTTLQGFYGKFEKDLEEATENMPRLKPEDEETDIKCDKCESPMVIKSGKKGKFLACSAYPKCKNIKNFARNEDGTVTVVEQEVVYHTSPCPNCGKRMVLKSGPYGAYYRCEDYPECKTTQPVTLDIDCPEPECDGKVVERRSKKKKVFFSCSNYPKCEFISWYKPVNRSCPECGHHFLTERYSRKLGETQLVCPKCNAKIEN